MRHVVAMHVYCMRWFFPQGPRLKLMNAVSHAATGNYISVDVYRI